MTWMQYERFAHMQKNCSVNKLDKNILLSKVGKYMGFSDL